MLYRLSYVGRASFGSSARMERVMGIEPTSSAWKAEVLPLNYTREGLGGPYAKGRPPSTDHRLVVGGGFEPPKAEPSDLQSDPFDHSGTPPHIFLEPIPRIERRTFSLQVRCSTN